MPNSYKVAVKTRNHSHEWVYNGLRFNFFEHAQAYAEHLRTRWPDIVQTGVHHCDEQPNAMYPMPSDRYPVQR